MVKYSIDDVRNIVESKGGLLLTNNYINCKEKVLIRCKNNHEWNVSFSKLKTGRWCPQCVGKKTIKDVQEIASSRGGESLSNTYSNVHKKILWKCKENHIWEATFNSVRKGSWCPKCTGKYNFGEEICRFYFEKFFNKKFLKQRPKWLIGSKGFVLELDGYCDEIGIAFEHQGIHHFNKDHFFNADNNIIENDYLKRNICLKNGVKLIEIPEIPKLLSLEKVPSFIKNECDKLNIKIPNYNKKLDYNILYDLTQNKLKIAQKKPKKMKELVCLNIILTAILRYNGNVKMIIFGFPVIH